MAAVAGVSLLAAAIILLWPSEPPARLDADGPSAGEGAPIFLFQSYSCATCWNHTLDGPLDDLVEAARLQGRQVVWKNVATESTNGALMSHCVWQEFPEEWQQWNKAAYLEQLEPGLGWPSMDRLLFITESELLLKRDETSRLERCLFEGPWLDQVRDDTRWWGGRPLPALYADGKWLQPTGAALRSLGA